MQLIDKGQDPNVTLSLGWLYENSIYLNIYPHYCTFFMGFKNRTPKK